MRPREDALVCSIWTYDGSSPCELFSDIKFRLSKCKDQMSIGEEGRELTFDFHKILNFEQLAPDVDDENEVDKDGPIQFDYLSTKSRLDTYGMHFPICTHAQRFRLFVIDRLEQTAESLISIFGKLFVQLDEKTWDAVSQQSTCRVLSRKLDGELFLCINHENGKKIIFESFSFKLGLAKQDKSLTLIATNQTLEYAYRDNFMFTCHTNENASDLWDTLGEAATSKMGNPKMDKLSKRKMEGVEYFDAGSGDDVGFDLGSDDSDVDMTWDGRNSKSENIKKGAGGDVQHKFMAVGEGNTIVCRSDGAGSQLDAYRRNDNGQMQNSSTIAANKLKYKQDKIVPMKAMLHSGGKKLLIRAEDHPTEVFMLDLEYETVVQSWDTNELQVNEFFPTFKGAQISSDQSFRAANSSAIFSMDTRLEGSARVASKIYSKSPQFTCGATDLEGHILMGSRTGELRLYSGDVNYDSNFKQSKTNLILPGREPVVAVEVTEDGSWIVATTREFLVAYPVREAATKRTGFEISLGKDKPQGRVLRISPADIVKHKIKSTNFTAAKFSTNEEYIFTSTGKIAVAWNMQSVRQGKPRYVIHTAPGIIRDVDVDPLDSSVVAAYTQDVDILTTC